MGGEPMTTSANDRYKDEMRPGVSLMAIDQYLREVAWIETHVLTDEEETRLFRQLKRSRSFPANQHYARVAKHAYEQLIEGYQPLVLMRARRYVRLFRSLELGDVVNEGNIGLMEAVESFLAAPEKGRFVSLATVCIDHNIISALHQTDAGVRLATSVVQVLMKIRRVSAEFEEKYDRVPSVGELAQMLEVSEERVIEVLGYGSYQRVASLQGLLAEEEHAEEYCAFSSVFGPGVGEEDQKRVQLREVVRDVCERELTAREWQVIQTRYLEEERTGKETARLLGLHPSVVGRKTEKALSRLRGVLAPYVESSGDIATVRSDQDAYYTVDQVASLFGLHPHRVCNLARAGRFPAEKVEKRVGGRVCWRFPKQAIDALVRSPHELSA
jgi:RNA polymerase sigma factor (sigma-70 family)